MARSASASACSSSPSGGLRIARPGRAIRRCHPDWRPQHAELSLLKRAGRAHKPVLLKRGIAATLEELLMAAEYIMSEGNYNVVLCERGVRTFADHTRNTLDLSTCRRSSASAICPSR